VTYTQAFGHFFHGLQDNWLWLIGLCLMAEPILDALWEGYRDWADQYVSRKIRTRVSWAIVISCSFIACFLAFADQAQKTEVALGQLEEARHSASPVQQSTIDRLSGDLTAARGRIDTQAQIIEQQQTEIERQKHEIESLHPKPDRHLSDDDKKRLEAIFTPLKTEYPTLSINAPGDGEAQGYAKELADEFNSIGIKVDRVGIVFPTSAEHAPLK